MDLKTSRESRGWTQQQLADELGLSKPYISQLETGVVPFNIKLALQIERLFAGAFRAVDVLPPDDAQLLQAAIDAGRELAGAAA